MSKNIIFYFTGTGNSLKVANDIAKELENCEVKLVTNFKDRTLADGYERVGFVFPIYAGNLPNYFIKFLKNVDFRKSSNAYFFAVSTQGSNSGNAGYNVNYLLSKQSLKLNGFYSVKMFANYVALYNMKDNAEKANEESSAVIKIVASDVRAKIKNNIPQKANPISKMMSNMMAQKFAENDKGFNVSNECNGCGICEKVCPVRNIELVANKPTFKHKCEQCMACIQNCPSKALNYKNKTQKRGRYRNPDVAVQDLFAEGK